MQQTGSCAGVPRLEVAALSRPHAEAVPAPLVRAWEDTVAGWGDASRHDIALGLAAKYRQFAWLAGRYRDAARARPEDPIPPARLARLQRAALVTLCCDTRPQPAPERRPYRGVVTMLIAAVVATAFALWLADAKAREVLQHKPQVTSKAR